MMTRRYLLGISSLSFPTIAVGSDEQIVVARDRKKKDMLNRQMRESIWRSSQRTKASIKIDIVSYPMTFSFTFPGERQDVYSSNALGVSFCFLLYTYTKTYIAIYCYWGQKSTSWLKYPTTGHCIFLSLFFQYLPPLLQVPRLISNFSLFVSTQGGKFLALTLLKIMHNLWISNVINALSQIYSFFYFSEIYI